MTSKAPYKGGVLPSDGCGGWGKRRLLQRRERSLRDRKLVRQSREGAGGGIAEAAQRREQRRQQDNWLALLWLMPNNRPRTT